jgi:hypothetical protein
METLDFKAEKELKIYTHTLYMQLGYELIWNRRKNGIRSGERWSKVGGIACLDGLDGWQKGNQTEIWEIYRHLKVFILFLSIGL